MSLAFRIVLRYSVVFIHLVSVLLPLFSVLPSIGCVFQYRLLCFTIQNGRFDTKQLNGEVTIFKFYTLNAINVLFPRNFFRVLSLNRKKS